MKAIFLGDGGGLDKLQLVDVPDPGDPKASEIRVRIHATSLNFHDLIFVTGQSPTSAGRIPISDGAGIVEAVGPGVSEIQGWRSCRFDLFPTWSAGCPHIGDFSDTPGDGIDGFAQEVPKRDLGTTYSGR